MQPFPVLPLRSTWTMLVIFQHSFLSLSLCLSLTLFFTCKIHFLRTQLPAIEISKHWIFEESSVVVQWIVNSLLANFLYISFSLMCMWVCEWVNAVRACKSANTLHVHVIIYILLGKSAMKWIALQRILSYFCWQKWKRIQDAKR